MAPGIEGFEFHDRAAREAAIRQQQRERDFYAASEVHAELGSAQLPNVPPVVLPPERIEQGRANAEALLASERQMRERRLAAALVYKNDWIHRLLLASLHWLPNLSDHRPQAAYDRLKLAGQASFGRDPGRVQRPELSPKDQQLWCSAFPELWTTPATVDLNAAAPAWSSPEIAKWFVRRAKAAHLSTPRSGWAFNSTQWNTNRSRLSGVVTETEPIKITISRRGKIQRECHIGPSGLQQIARVFSLADDAMNGERERLD